MNIHSKVKLALTGIVLLFLISSVFVGKLVPESGEHLVTAAPDFKSQTLAGLFINLFLFPSLLIIIIIIGALFGPNSHILHHDPLDYDD